MVPLWLAIAVGMSLLAFLDVRSIVRPLVRFRGAAGTVRNPSRKGVDAAELIEAIRTAARGEIHLTPGQAKLVRFAIEQGATDPPRGQ